MIYTFDCDRWGSSFSVPSKVVDKYIKLSDGDFVKVLLCICLLYTSDAADE